MLRSPSLRAQLSDIHYLIDIGELIAAREKLTPLLTIKHGGVQTINAYLLMHEGKLDDAEAICKTIPGIVAKLLIAAIYADYRKQPDIAIQKYIEIEKLFPNDPRAFLCHAHCIDKEVDPQKKITILKTVLKITDDTNFQAKAYHALSISYDDLCIVATAKGETTNALNYRKQAEENALLAVETDPTYAPALSRFAKLFIERAQGTYEKLKSRMETARHLYDKAMHDNPERFKQNHDQKNHAQQKIIVLPAEMLNEDTCHEQAPQDRKVLDNMKAWAPLSATKPKPATWPKAAVKSSRMFVAAQVVSDKKTGKTAIKSLIPFAGKKH